MRDAFADLLGDVTLVTVALGWALFQVAEGVSTLVSTLLTDHPPAYAAAARLGEPLIWDVGGNSSPWGLLSPAS